MKTTLITLSVLLIASFIARALFNRPSAKINLSDGKKFVEKLDELGYFKYADKKDKDSLKQELITSFNPNNELVTLWDEESGAPLDYRYYFCDGETLFEQGGFTEILSELQPTFQKIGLEITVTEHQEEWDTENEWLNHSITINNQKYTIFKNFKDYGWGEATQRLVDIINDQLSKQQKEDRLYPVSGGNDGRLIFLSYKQYKYIYSIYKNPEWKPLEIKEWCDIMGVKYMSVK
ncbi:hypothetical protein FUA48_01135 [Flavobacterium alkalisoli]|uniref:Uncharacterized protein n=1 Tax=Flavobacterium alkalisoli TaxID=2602769 RepID=A0A5B9FU34_9FLAO|nr:hypothetical protein [Flavobacterium alkalisoli]QEE48227.1 hypothetical protein FUA48_01135 [Flavobacterium alkalisoli]